MTVFAHADAHRAVARTVDRRGDAIIREDVKSQVYFGTGQDFAKESFIDRTDAFVENLSASYGAAQILSTCR